MLRPTPDLAPHGLPTADELDNVLHRERLTRTGKRLLSNPGFQIYRTAFSSVFPAKQPHISSSEKRFGPGLPAGYQKPIPRPVQATVEVLTPASTVRAIAAGYLPDISLSQN